MRVSVLRIISHHIFIYMAILLEIRTTVVVNNVKFDRRHTCVDLQKVRVTLRNTVQVIHQHAPMIRTCVMALHVELMIMGFFSSVLQVNVHQEILNVYPEVPS